MVAAQFGSEGQQRSAALALKITQAYIFQREDSVAAAFVG
jgi:recombinational DNA repair ATPase RecF